jgi:dephospho-CoA kinase
MRALAFADPAARGRLEAILHPMIRDISAQRCRAATSPYVILAVPLLVESGTYRERCDRIAVVDCPEALQVARVMARSGLGEAEVRAIMAAQASRTARLAAADDVIANDAGLDELHARVAVLDAFYRAAAAEKSAANR